MAKDLLGSIDWLSLTFPESVDIGYLFESVLQLPFDDFTELDYGRYFYRSQYKLENITVLTDGQEGMGHHVVMTGQGVRLFESRVIRDAGDWPLWLSFVRGLGAKCTRLDLSLDDRPEADRDLFFDLDMVSEAVAAGGLCSRFHSFSDVRGVNLGKEVSSAGRTLYFGSRKGKRVLVRMYDKGAEQDLDEEWIRTEVELHDERANVALDEIARGSSFGSLCRGILKHYLAFKRRPVGEKADSNKSRWVYEDWWAQFIGAVEAVRLTVLQPLRTIETVVKWVERQTAISLAMIFANKGSDGFRQWFEGLMDSGFVRAKPKHWALSGGGGV